MNVVIVEDEPTAARGLTSLLMEIDPSIEIIHVLDSIEASSQWFSANDVYDLIFMDVELKDGNCFKIFESMDIFKPVIFCTAYDAYAIEAFKVNSIDYLLKPIDADALHQSLNKYRKLRRTQNTESGYGELLQLLQGKMPLQKERFLVKAGRKFYHINVDDIAYVFTENRVVYAMTKTSRQFQMDHSMDEMEDCLPARKFFRVSRQYLLNIDCIENIESDYGKLMVTMTTGSAQVTTGVSRNRADQFKQWLNQ